MASIIKSFNAVKQRFNEHKLDIDECMENNRTIFNSQFEFLAGEIDKTKKQFAEKIKFQNQCLVVSYIIIGIILITVGLLILKGL